MAARRQILLSAQRSWASVCRPLRIVHSGEAAALVGYLQIREEIHKNVNCYCGLVERYLLIFNYFFIFKFNF